MKPILPLLLSLLTAAALQAQAPHSHPHPHPHDRSIHFPDITSEGTGRLLTLTCDFHQHTVFSDGSVWPDIRVQE